MQVRRFSVLIFANQPSYSHETTYILDDAFPSCWLLLRKFTCAVDLMLTLHSTSQSIWSMNIDVILPQSSTKLWEYFAVTFPLMVLSAYVIVAYQLEIKIPSRKPSDDEDVEEDNDTERNVTLKELTFWNRVFWPAFLVWVLLARWRWKTKETTKSVFGL